MDEVFDRLSLKENGLMFAIHIILYVVGYYLVRFFGSDSSVAAILFIAIFIAVKLGYFLYFSNKKKLNEKIVNFLVISFLGTIEFFVYLIIILSFLQLSNWSFNTFNHFLIFILFIISIICIPLLEKHTMKNMKMENIWPYITVAFFEILFSILLFVVDTKESAIISAFSALLIFLFTPKNSKILFNVKVSKYREQQISQIRFGTIFLLPIMYVISRIFPIPECNYKPNDIVTVLILRLISLGVISLILMFFIYSKRFRLFIQEWLGLSSKQADLNGTWNMIIKNKYTNKDIIVRKFLLNIDGIMITYNKKIFNLNKNLEVLNDDEEKIGKIIKIDSEHIILKIDDKGERKSLRKSKNYIKLIKVGSEEYKNFKQKYEEKNAVFYNIKTLDPITKKDIEVTIFLCYKDTNNFIEANSKTSDECKLANDLLVELEGDEESLSRLNIYKSDAFN